MLVRCTLAQHVADLAEIALKFLELSHWPMESNATAATPTELVSNFRVSCFIVVCCKVVKFILFVVLLLLCLL